MRPLYEMAPIPVYRTLEGFTLKPAKNTTPNVRKAKAPTRDELQQTISRLQTDLQLMTNARSRDQEDYVRKLRESEDRADKRAIVEADKDKLLRAELSLMIRVAGMPMEPVTDATTWHMYNKDKNVPSWTQIVFVIGGVVAERDTLRAAAAGRGLSGATPDSTR